MYMRDHPYQSQQLVTLSTRQVKTDCEADAAWAHSSPQGFLGAAWAYQSRRASSGKLVQPRGSIICASASSIIMAVKVSKILLGK